MSSKRVRECCAAILLVACGGVSAAPVAPLPSVFQPRSAATPVLSQGSTMQPAPLPAPTNAVAAAPSLPEVSQGDIGVAGAAELLATSATGAWVALCQGAPRSPSLVLGSGSGEPIDDVLAQDPNGRYLVVRTTSGSALLIDAVAGGRVDLTALAADVRRTRTDYAAHRSLSFSADGQLLAYLRREGLASQVVVRQLASGSERKFPSGAGEVFRLRLSADARYVTLEALRDDTTQNGKFDWPLPEEAPGKGACSGSDLPKFRSFAHLGRGDAPTRAVLELASGKLRDVPGLVTPLGAPLLVRENDASLRLDHDGKRVPLVPASCGGRVLFADAERGLALVSCALPKKPGKRSVWLFGAGYAKDLQSELYETSTDREAVSGVRLVPIYPGSETALVDLERRELLPLAIGSRVLAVSGDLALVWRGSELLRYDARLKSETRVAQGVLKNPDLLQAGPATVLLSPFVVVDGFTTALKSPSERPLALSVTGHVLTGTPGANSDAIQGPLRWLDARLPATHGPAH